MGVRTVTKYRQPDPDEMEALRSYAAEFGRTWKSRLREDWYHARLRSGPGNRGSILHGLRNDPRFGPAGLDAFRFPKET